MSTQNDGRFVVFPFSPRVLPDLNGVSDGLDAGHQEERYGRRPMAAQLPDGLKVRCYFDNNNGEIHVEARAAGTYTDMEEHHT